VTQIQNGIAITVLNNSLKIALDMAVIERTEYTIY